jgi:transposase
MSEGSSTWVGLDAHKKAINVAAFFAGKGLVEFEVANTASAIRQLAKRLREGAGKGEVFACYEAGPCGYALQRALEKHGVNCSVIAPSLIPVKPGQRIKTDRRDARKLGELLRAGLLTEVHPPSPEQEAVRDLCRCREDAREDLLRARHRLSKMLLRRAILAPLDMRAWGSRHRKWLRTVHFDTASDQAVSDDYLLSVEHIEARLKVLDTRLQEASEQPLYKQPVAWLRCFRGIDVVTAMTIAAELHGLERFESPRDLMAYLGLVPSEHSSSDSRRRGSITKAGNGHVRRALIEAAWHYLRLLTVYQSRTADEIALV